MGSPIPTEAGSWDDLPSSLVGWGQGEEQVANKHLAFAGLGYRIFRVIKVFSSHETVGSFGQ